MNTMPALSMVAIDWFAEERAAFAPPPRMTVSEWAEQNRVLPSGPSRQPGPWRNATTPYLVDIMDTFNDPDVKHMVLCFGTQLGKTETIYNILGFSIDLEPFPAFLVINSIEHARKVSRTRVKPTIEATPSLKKKIPWDKDYYQTLEMHFPGMILHMAGANSKGEFSEKSCRTILRDEIDKWPDSFKDAGDPLAMSEGRAKAFWDIRKVVDVSSPTLAKRGILKQLEGCDEIRRYYLPCPHCGHEAVLNFENIKWDHIDTDTVEPLQARIDEITALEKRQPLTPEEQEERKSLLSEIMRLKEEHTDVERVNYAKRSARYECGQCSQVIGDHHKQAMLVAGTWKADKQSKYTPERVGFHLSSLYSPWLTWGDICEEFLKATTKLERDRDQGPLQIFINEWLAEGWEDHAGKSMDVKVIEVLKDDRPSGLVPSGIRAITAGADTQDNGFYYTIRAWGGEGLVLESYLVRKGFVVSFGALADVLYMNQYRDIQGTQHIINLTLIDSQGHRTSDVYDFCMRHPGINPVKGERTMTTGYKFTDLEFYPGTDKKLPGALKLVRLDSNFFKNMLASRLQIAPEDPGAFRFHSEIDHDFCRQMTSEYRDDKGHWQVRAGRANHYWDCEYMNVAAAEILGVKHMPSPAAVQQQQQQAKQKAKDGSGFVGNTGGWSHG